MATDEFEYDEVRGKKKPVMALLNRQRVHPLEMEELLNIGWEE